MSSFPSFDLKTQLILWILRGRRAFLYIQETEQASEVEKAWAVASGLTYWTTLPSHHLFFSATKFVLLSRRALKCQRTSSELYDAFLRWQKALLDPTKSRCQLERAHHKTCYISPSIDAYLRLKYQQLEFRIHDIWQKTTLLLRALLLVFDALLDVLEIHLLSDVSNFDSLTHLPIHLRKIVEEIGEFDNNYALLLSHLEEGSPILKSLGYDTQVQCILSHLKPLVEKTSKTAQTVKPFFVFSQEITEDVAKYAFTGLFLFPLVALLGPQNYPIWTLPLKDLDLQQQEILTKDQA